MLTPRSNLGCDMARYTFNLRNTMNRFFIYRCPRKSARYMCDKHIVKMPLEEAQQLCTAHRWLDGDDEADAKGLYNSAHLNHPASVGVRSSYDNYMWAYMHFQALLDEKLRRYPDNPPHKSGELSDYLSVPPVNINRFVGFTSPPQCMPDEYKHSNYVTAYRNYYRQAKKHIATWKSPATPPNWW